MRRLEEKLINIAAKLSTHALDVAFQMAEVAIAQNLFADILRLIADLRAARPLRPRKAFMSRARPNLKERRFATTQKRDIPGLRRGVGPP